MRELSIHDSSDAEPVSVRSTRRMATVTISVPDASCAAFITPCEGYLPVPTTSREPNVRPAMTSGSTMLVSAYLMSAAPDECDDLHFGAFHDHRLAVARALDHEAIAFHCNRARVDVQPVEQLRDRQRSRQLRGISIQNNLHVRSPKGSSSCSTWRSGCGTSAAGRGLTGAFDWTARSSSRS